ncbi:PEP-CTERM sorting domain-containing protein [Planctomycetota bacterium]|nr:PEP-CTERM sorting domain-containing protein [Planctomycetota bacterium]
MKSKFFAMGTALAAGVMFGNANAAVLFSTSFDDGTDMSVITTNAGDTTTTFGVDYSAMGIPSATGTADTTGLRIDANIAAPADAQEVLVVVDATSVTLPSSFIMSFKAWANVSRIDGDNTTTEFIGGVANHDGTSTGRTNGNLTIVTGDGGSATDLRTYVDGGLENDLGTGIHGPALTTFNAPDLATAGILGTGKLAPAAQVTAGNGDTAVQDGAGAFEWIDFKAIVDGSTTMWYMNDELIVTHEGQAAGTAGVYYGDFFSSVALNSQFQYGIFDDLKITDIPEPASLALFGLGALAMIRRRK